MKTFKCSSILLCFYVLSINGLSLNNDTDIKINRGSKLQQDSKLWFQINDGGETDTKEILQLQNCADIELYKTDLDLIASRYYFNQNLKLNWYEANQFCLYHNTVLATPTTAADDQRLMAFFQQYIKPLGSFLIWTAANDLGLTNKYVMSTTGNQLSYTNFRSGEPSHAVSNGETESCVSWDYPVGTNYPWNDLPCSRKINFVCEVKKVIQFRKKSECTD